MRYKWPILVILTLLVIQMVPYGQEHANPPVATEPAWDNPRTRALFIRTCGDCHSHETDWPWYSHIAPVSWLVQNDVDEGREHFNISMWGLQEKNKGDEAYEEFREGDMPPWFYLLPHPEAWLADQEKSLFLEGLLATFGRDRQKDDD